MTTRAKPLFAVDAPPREPLGAFQVIPRNQWYIAAGRAEVSDAPLARTVAGEPLALFRDKAGGVHAMRDACPHRGFPLSKSRVCDSGIQCAYHGMIFNHEGACISMARPQDRIPRVMRATVFPVVEKWHWIWVFVGDPARADPADIPDFERQDDVAYDHRFYAPLGPIACNFQIIHDNLCDATHTSYLHAGLLDDPGETQMSLATPLVERLGPVTLRVTRVMEGFVPNEMVAPLYNLQAGSKYNRLLVGYHHFPSSVVYYNRYYDYTDNFCIDDPGNLVSEHITSLGITPSDHRHSFHLTAASTSWPQTEQDREGLLYVIDQDLVAFADIQHHFESFPELAVETSIANDKIGIMSRRIIAELME